MARGDAALIAFVHRLERQILEASRVGVVGVVHQHVNVEIVPLGDVKANVDVAARVLVRVLVPGQSADDVAAFTDGFFHEFGSAWVARDPLLRKRHDLDPAVFLHLLACEQQAARSAQSADRPDIGEQAKERRPVHDADFEGANGACRNLGGIVVTLEVVGDLDGFGQGARLVRPHDLAKQALVGVKMQIEKAGKHEAAGGVDLMGRFRGEAGAYG